MTHRDEERNDSKTATEIRHMSVLLEQVISQNQAILESMDTMIETKIRPTIQEELTPIKQDIELIKKAVTETNQDVHKLDLRVARLETSQHYA